MKFFFWGPKWGVLGGGQKVYVEKVYVLFPPLKTGGRRAEQAKAQLDPRVRHEWVHERAHESAHESPHESTNEG